MTAYHDDSLSTETLYKVKLQEIEQITGKNGKIR